MDETPIIEKFQELSKVTHKGIRFAEPHGVMRHYSYAELMKQAQHVAGGLQKKGVKTGDAVILVMATPEAAIFTILACMILGCPPTPVYPPMNLQAVPGFLRFLKHVANRSQAKLVVAEGKVFSFLGSIPHDTETVREVTKFETLIATPSSKVDSTPGKVAFLQFTSGSTAEPKGVVVTHRGLAANLSMIREASHMNESSSVVTWLPVYHDMGLIGTVLNAITLPCDLTVIPPTLFLKKPRLWLEMITQFHGTHTAAPNFAYGICARRISDVSGLDLSKMTTFICGAEPVMPATMEQFVTHYQSAGLRSEAMVPAYGLAEATLAVTFTPYLRGLCTDTVDLFALSESRTANRPMESGTVHSVRIVSCGMPMPGLSVRIANEEGLPLPDRKVGEVQVSGPSVTPGYINDEPATRASKTQDDWLKTGDLGYMAGGELYICGRIKDVIIIRGKNFHAHDLESIASEVPGVRTGNVVAFGSSNETAGESLVVIAESRNQGEFDLLRRTVRNRLSESFGITPDEVLIVQPGTLPKTSSGKLKRLEAKRLYETGNLHTRPGKFAAYFHAIKSGLGFLKRKGGQ